MTCRLCAWLCDRLCPPEARRDFWSWVSDWEHREFDWEPAEPDQAVRERWHEAAGLSERDPAAALAIYRELADGGSPYSMMMAAWHYRAGRGAEQDIALAEDYYRRALNAGSWAATIQYARLLFARGAHDAWPSTLQDGVRNGFIPAHFWLAWYSYELSPTRRTAREMRSPLESAAGAGHPAAKMMLSRWMATGKLGLREIPRGVCMAIEVIRTDMMRTGDSAEPSQQYVAANPG